MKLLAKDKLGNKLKLDKIKIGILGGTFDPAHKGHLAISSQAKKALKLSYIIWAITKKNPFKDKSFLSLNKRIKFAKKITNANKYIKVRYFEDKIKSNKIFNLINYIKKNKKLDVFFIMGADNLINFHKWHKWRSISQKCNIVVFDRNRYKTKSLKSIAFKRLNNNKNLRFIKTKKVNISSSQLRKI
jgi:nicotinate-nucleotide adenylyltransferase